MRARKADAAALEEAVFVVLRCAAMARAGLSVTPAAFLRAALVRLRIDPPAGASGAGTGFDGVEESALAASIELGRYRFRCKSAPPVAFPAAAAAAAASPQLQPADIGDVNLAKVLVEGETDFRLLADRNLHKVTPEAFLSHYLLGSGGVVARGGGLRELGEAWEDLSLVWHICDLDEDGFLDGIEFATARYTISFFAARGERLAKRFSTRFGQRPVLPPSLVHQTKRSMAAKLEMSFRRVHKVFVLGRAGDSVAAEMREKVARILAKRNYTVAESSGGAHAIVVLMTPRCLDDCVKSGDAMFRELRSATGALEGQRKVIVPIFHPSYWEVDYFKVSSEREKLRKGDGVERVMELVRVAKGAELNDMHLEAVAKILHNLLQGRELSMEED